MKDKKTRRLYTVYDEEGRLQLVMNRDAVLWQDVLSRMRRRG